MGMQQKERGRLRVAMRGQVSDDVGGAVPSRSGLGLLAKLRGALAYRLVLVVHDASDSLDEALGRPRRAGVLAALNANA